MKQSTLREAFESGKLNSGASTGYGFGWDLGKDFVSHGGAWLGFRTWIIRYVTRRLTIVVLANCTELNASCMGEDVARLYLDTGDHCSVAGRSLQ